MFGQLPIQPLNGKKKISNNLFLPDTQIGANVLFSVGAHSALQIKTPNLNSKVFFMPDAQRKGRIWIIRSDADSAYHLYQITNFNSEVFLSDLNINSNLNLRHYVQEVAMMALNVEKFLKSGNEHQRFMIGVVEDCFDHMSLNQHHT